MLGNYKNVMLNSIKSTLHDFFCIKFFLNQITTLMFFLNCKYSWFGLNFLCPRYTYIYQVLVIFSSMCFITNYVPKLWLGSLKLTNLFLIYRCHIIFNYLKKNCNQSYIYQHTHNLKESMLLACSLPSK